MSDLAVLTAIDGPVATVTLNRPEAHNALDDRLIAGLTGALRMLGDTPAVRAVVLRANGESFSAGADIARMRRLAEATEATEAPEATEATGAPGAPGVTEATGAPGAPGAPGAEALAEARALTGLLDTLDTLPKPTLALVHGAAFGGGVALVACCDIAIAADQAAFSVSAVKLGLVPAVTAPYVVAAIGSRAARRCLLTGERISALEARRLGLVHEVVPGHMLAAAGAAVLTRLAEGGPEAQAGAKALIRTLSGRAAGPADDDTLRRIAAARTTPEAQEGLAAFLEKRNPRWRED